MAKKIKCPKCGSLNFEALGSTKKSVSAGKAVIGGVLAGPAGFAIGGLMGKKGKTALACHDCGTTWQIKL